MYLSICINLLEKAQWFNAEQNDKLMAFTYYYRYLDLCLIKLSNHPQIKTSQNYGSKSSFSQYNDNDEDLELYRKQYKQLIDLEIPIVLKIIEDLKLEIDSIYNKQQSSLANSISIAKKPIAKNNIKNNSNSILNNKTITGNPPQTFNQNRFNQSISFFNTSNNLNNNSSITNNNNTTNTSNHIDTNTSRSRSNSTNVNNNNETTNGNELIYPELPQLSFPTF